MAAKEALHRLPAPVVLVGSAESGKTAVTLAKLREAEGRVLYITQSAPWRGRHGRSTSPMGTRTRHRKPSS